MTVYKATTQTLIRRIKDVKSLGANIIVLCHETEKEVDYGEGVEKRRAPDLNEALLALVYSSSSDIARLRVLTEAKTNKDGVVVMPKGARVLDFSINDDFMAKWHIDLDNAVSGKIPTLISRPSYPKVCKALNKTPTWLTTYGRPGAGKTTFSISQLIDPEGIGIGL